MLLRGDKLLERRLARFLEIQPGRFLVSSKIQSACVTPAVRPDSWLLFFPDTHDCLQIAHMDTLILRQRLHAITGRWPPADLLGRLQQQPFLTLLVDPDSKPVPALRSQSLRLPECTCDANTAPQGVVACEVQTRTIGARIAVIEYLVTDADGDPLVGVFSHQRDTNPVQSGLPSPLAFSCGSDLGTLQCTITGNAPGQAGDFRLMLAVSDGAATLNLASLLKVSAASSDQIFLDSFATPVCL